jgi:hypothetical protein
MLYSIDHNHIYIFQYHTYKYKQNETCYTSTNSTILPPEDKITKLVKTKNTNLSTNSLT